MSAIAILIVASLLYTAIELADPDSSRADQGTYDGELPREKQFGTARNGGALLPLRLF